MGLPQESQSVTVETEPEREESGIVKRSRLAVQISSYDEKRLTPEERDQLLELFSESEWPGEVREFALHCMVPESVDAGILDDLRRRLTFITANIPLDVLGNHRDFTFTFLMSQLLKGRFSYLEAINSLLGKEGWREILSRPDALKDFGRASYVGSPLYSYTKDMFPGISQRFSVPMEADPAVEGGLEEFNEVLEVTKLSELAMPLVRAIRIAEHGSDRGMAGQFHKKTGDLTVSVPESSKHFLIPAILHELGHAFELQLARDPEARAIFDHYIVLSQAEGVDHSPYARTFEREWGRASNHYITESFAEDFRLFWLKPVLLSESKRAVFEDLLGRLILPVSHDEIRRGIHYALKNYYNSDAEAILGEIDCFDMQDYVGIA